MYSQTHLPEDKQTEIKKYHRTLVGNEFEDELFKNLQTTLKNLKAQNTTAFSGFKEKATKSNNESEFDFVVVNSDSKLIVHIEAKSYKNVQNGSQRKSASEQLDKGYKYFRSMSIPSSENWLMARIMAFRLNGERVCERCKQFVLDQSMALDEPWWESLLESAQIKTKNSGSENSSGIIPESTI